MKKNYKATSCGKHQVRCKNDNKLLFNKTNGIIEIKCGRCKKVHIFEVVKKN